MFGRQFIISERLLPKLSEEAGDSVCVRRKYRIYRQCYNLFDAYVIITAEKLANVTV